jgi:hypothetical protein
MSTTLTVDLDSGVLELAEQEARARHTTLPEVVAHRLFALAETGELKMSGCPLASCPPRQVIVAHG